MGQSIYINGEGFKVVGVSESSEVDESGMPIESLIQIPSKHLINIWAIDTRYASIISYS